MSLIDASCDIQRLILTLLQPKEVSLLSCTSQAFSAVCGQTRRAILLSRHKLKVRRRHASKALQQREQFLQQECKLQLPLLDEKTAQTLILEKLQRSPDGIRDLAAAVQAALGAVTRQTSTAPHVLKAVKDDLVRMANFVCLLAWRQHLRSRRAQQHQRQQRQQQQQQQAENQAAAPDGLNAAGDNDPFVDEDVQVVLLEPEVEPVGQPLQQQQQQQQEPEHAPEPVQQPGVAAAIPGGAAAQHQQQQQLEPADGAAQLEQQQHPQHAEAAAPAASHLQVASVSSQTDGLGPSMAEMAELVSGLRGLMAPASPGTKPCRATLNLLVHYIEQQLQAWHLPVVGIPADAGNIQAAGEHEVAE